MNLLFCRLTLLWNKQKRQNDEVAPGVPWWFAQPLHITALNHLHTWRCSSVLGHNLNLKQKDVFKSVNPITNNSDGDIFFYRVID